MLFCAENAIWINPPSSTSISACPSDLFGYNLHYLSLPLLIARCRIDNRYAPVAQMERSNRVVVAPPRPCFIGTLLATALDISPPWRSQQAFSTSTTCLTTHIKESPSYFCAVLTNPPTTAVPHPATLQLARGGMWLALATERKQRGRYAPKCPVIGWS